MDDVESAGRRRPSPGWARRMEATRRDLAESATDLFIRRGYSATTVDDIATAAGVSRRTFFRHYPTKQDVFLLPALDEVADFDEVLATQDDTGDPLADAAAAMRRSVEERREFLDDSRTLYRTIRSTTELRGAVRTFNLAFEHGFATWYADRTGVDPESTSARMFAACVIAVRETALARWSEEPDVDLLDHLDDAWRALADLSSRDGP